MRSTDGRVPVKPEAALESVRQALSPAPREQQGFLIRGAAYWTLEGAKLDLERMGADPICI